MVKMPILFVESFKNVLPELCSSYQTMYKKHDQKRDLPRREKINQTQITNYIILYINNKHK